MRQTLEKQCCLSKLSSHNCLFCFVWLVLTLHAPPCCVKIATTIKKGKKLFTFFPPIDFCFFSRSSSLFLLYRIYLIFSFILFFLPSDKFLVRFHDWCVISNSVRFSFPVLVVPPLVLCFYISVEINVALSRSFLFCLFVRFFCFCFHLPPRFPQEFFFHFVFVPKSGFAVFILLQTRNGTSRSACSSCCYST